MTTPAVPPKPVQPKQFRAERLREITCTKYQPDADGRCQHYLPSGGCRLPDEFMCVEWTRANPLPRSAPVRALPTAPEAKPEPAPGRHDLFGNSVPDEPAPGRATTKPRLWSVPVHPVATLPGTTEPKPPALGLNPEDIASFKSFGVEVCLRVQELGELWLVPAYTGKARKEITPEHLVTLLHMLAAFPGAQVVAFAKSSESAPTAQKESRP